ncbi:MAG: methylmalonyl Co-A mutase-associated GTPase MeaB [Aggregatilineales bacterium]
MPLTRRELARLLTRVENRQADTELAALYRQTGHAHVIGITGAPGTGKSSLVNTLALHYRAQGRTVAILAVDPTSPFTGGAILGDRIRMRDLSGDPGVFIRSMATRGALGGLAATTADMIRVLDASAFDLVMVETVGAGQSEVDIAHMAHTTLVIEAPGLGDDVQAIKAGILEIADILVVNKIDRPGAENAVRALRANLELGHHAGWQPPILQTVALESKGIAELAEQIDKHRAFLQQSGEWQRRERARLESELTERLRDALWIQLRAHLDPRAMSETLDRLVTRQIDPITAVHELLAAQGQTQNRA